MPLWMQNSWTKLKGPRKNTEARKRIEQIKQEKHQLLEYASSVSFLDSRTEPAYRKLHREQLLLESTLENLERKGDESR